MSGKSIAVICGKVISEPKRGGKGEVQFYVNVARWRKDEGHPEGGQWEKNPIFICIHGPNADKALVLTPGEDRIFLTGELDMLTWKERAKNGEEVERRLQCVRAYRFSPGMSDNINQVLIVGRLGRDAEIKFFPNGGSITRFGVAVDRWEPGESGTKGSSVTVWSNVTIVGKRAEAAAEYLKKGKGVVIEGFLESRNYEDTRLGKNVWTTEVKSFNFDFTPGGGGGRASSDNFSGGEFPDEPPMDAGYGQPDGESRSTSSRSVADLDDEIPF